MRKLVKNPGNPLGKPHSRDRLASLTDCKYARWVPFHAKLMRSQPQICDVLYIPSQWFPYSQVTLDHGELLQIHQPRIRADRCALATHISIYVLQSIFS